MPQIQDVIHKFEEGSGLRYLKYGVMGLALLALMLSYNFRGFRDMSNPEAMDSAQLARNIARGHGYTTLFVRPFSMYLLKKEYEEKHGRLPLDKKIDASQIAGFHPDISNAPLYPVLLAGVMKAAPGSQYQKASDAVFTIGRKKFNLWNYGGSFWIYPPDFWISLFNQFLFLVSVRLLFVLARQLFDANLAWTCSAIYIGSDIFWRFSISGLSTMLVILIFLALSWTLLQLHSQSEKGKQLLLASLIGALTAAGCMTRYSIGWLIFPALLFILMFCRQHRVILTMAAIATFSVIVGLWVARNYSLTHTPFGTAGYSVYENTAFFPEYRLGRSLDPDLTRVRYDQLWNKLIANGRGILQEDLQRLGGGWISAFFLVGLLFNFKNSAANRLRGFLLLCLPFLIVAQALGRTQLSQDSPIVNSENLLIIVAPLVILFGTSFFYTLLDQMRLPIIQLRYLVVGVFCFFICLPAILNIFSPRMVAISYPPYYPPVIQQTAGWMRPDELMMSDIPWGVAWYGQRQCIWLTLNAQKDFFDVSDLQKNVSAVYLTPITLDSRILTQWVRAAEYSWGSFALDCMLKQELPPNFPLKHAPDHFLPEQLFLTDSDRWQTNAVAAQ